MSWFVARNGNAAGTPPSEKRCCVQEHLHRRRELSDAAGSAGVACRCATRSLVMHATPRENAHAAAASGSRTMDSALRAARRLRNGSTDAHTAVIPAATIGNHRLRYAVATRVTRKPAP